MDRRAFESYSASFVQALAAFDEVAGIAALGSTADPEILDSHITAVMKVPGFTRSLAATAVRTARPRCIDRIPLP